MPFVPFSSLINVLRAHFTAPIFLYCILFNLIQVMKGGYFKAVLLKMPGYIGV